jgi:type IV pilus assembly protein PilC
MNFYRFKSVDNFGKFHSGKMQAENQLDLTAMLKSNGQELISFKEEKKSFLTSLFSFIKTKDLVVIFVQLEQLDRAGVSLLDSIYDLKETSDSPRVKSLMSEVYDSIRNGSLFSESLAKHPDIFKPVYIGLLSAGEKTGNLSDAFASIIEDLKWNADIKRKASKAIRGPLFGIFVMIIVLSVMTSVVIPKVTSFLLAQNIDLPAITTSLISFSDFFKAHGIKVVIAIPSLWFSQKLIAKYSNNLAIKIDNLKLKTPIIGPILNKIDSAKFCQFFSITFKSGMGVLECLEAASKVVQNQAIRNAILNVKYQVSDGQSLAKSVESVGYFPRLVIRMLKIGEESGNMENALANIKFFYDREINDSIEKLVSMIQPALTIVMGGMIGWITIAVFGPIYETFSKIQ